ncbi:tetratricopeptide repeat protein [Prescottella equi]|jgi:putative thioredoxin|uniref:Tetratricopeptide repeat protein n=1 Tax=Rhodococcus hoagii TaxID=43767 RepID=A0AAE2W2P5_RHOHA|nr:tetratricopeptide repeat protein [Prescottella equi]AVP68217.1 co-chaperone YbbN [Prescottella equi]MBM4481744.1 tetratricopeptide repeat protein [Prescottella equi]MBM4484018.1 tetratricopeptide repeat protein [Prescottella equi]MBM4540151.1 tetratricopeptide repeat protein [Prescottella equi]MBM4555020.1 tetratricopeptide repeat protein [Prescottella equi]
MAGAVDLSGLKDRAPAPPSPSVGPPADGSAPVNPTGLAPVVDVTEATFQTEVLDRSNQVLVIVDLWATWCGPCKQLSPVLEKLAHEGGGNWVLAKIDVDANPGIAQAFGVQSVPTVVAIAAGRPLADFAGAQPEPQLRQWIAALQEAVAGKLSGPPSADGEPEPEPEDPRFVAAENALDEGDFAGAEAAYNLILNSEPANQQAQAALRQVRFLARVQDLPADAVAVADAQPDSIDAQFAAADAELYSQQPEAAFDRLVALVKRTFGDDRTTVRTRLLELFELFDPAEPIVVAARRKLASALY